MVGESGEKWAVFFFFFSTKIRIEMKIKYLYQVQTLGHSLYITYTKCVKVSCLKPIERKKINFNLGPTSPHVWEKWASLLGEVGIASLQHISVYQFYSY